MNWAIGLNLLLVAQLDPIPQFRAMADLGEFLETRFSQSFEIRLADWRGGHRDLIAHLATSNERDGDRCLDHPRAVNVVHNSLDFLADHPHTND